MEPDISILRKTGHFYFALTRECKMSAFCFGALASCIWLPGRGGRRSDSALLQLVMQVRAQFVIYRRGRRRLPAGSQWLRLRTG
jgi:hypothetical protein